MVAALHVQSQYSILGALGTVEALVEKAKRFGFSALALTDAGNLFGAVEFYKACCSSQIDPIIGAKVFLSFTKASEKKRSVKYPNSAPILLYAKNEIGYHNLCKLSSLGFLEGFYYVPRNDKQQLEQYAEGLICVAGFQGSYLSYFALNEQERFEQELLFFKKVFGADFYLNIERQAPFEEVDSFDEPFLKKRFTEFIENQELLETLILEQGKKHHIDVVATHLCKYIEKKEARAHEILINVQSKEPIFLFEKDGLLKIKAKTLNPKRSTEPSRDFEFKSVEALKTLFKEIPEVVENTEKIHKKCVLKLDLKTRHYPGYFPPGTERTISKKERKEKATQFLKTLCKENIKIRYPKEKLDLVRERFPEKDPLEFVSERLDYELGIVISKGLVDYLLIVYDFINWAKMQNIPIGPGRGSGTGSIILYLTSITDIEPLSLNLFFERFINPERPSFPDIDVDICMDRRQEVIEYTQRKYGKDNVAQIITFGKMKAKMAIKDVGRVLNVPLVKVNKIAKLVPEDIGITLDRALQMDPDLHDLYTQDAETQELIDYAKTLEGCVRNTGIHAAGVIICEDPIYEHIPVCMSKDAQMAVTQYSMKPVEDVGMLKIDFLGLKTLTTIQKTIEAIKERYGTTIDWSNLPMNDQKTFDLLNEGKTLGIFQLESGGMRELAKQLHIDRFEEIMAANALYRPGPMEMIPSFIARKHKKESIEQDHPLMTDILKETYGIMVYQEQVMQIASKLAGYSLGEGDLLRKAMGKKDKKEMSKQRKKFVKGCIDHHIDEQIAIKVFDKIERFASYGFNKSHAAAYGYISYTTAFLKAHYPAEWMAALMTCDYGDTSKVAKYIAECSKLDIAILPPSINNAGGEFIATGEGIRFALSAIKGIGTGVVEMIVKNRKEKGSFKSLYDFLYRLDPKKIGRKTVELLVSVGAFDFTQWTRDELRLSASPICDLVEQKIKEQNAGIISMFAQIEAQGFEKKPLIEKPSSKLEILQKEKELMGFFLTGHPLEDYKKQLQHLEVKSLEEVNMETEGIFKTAFIIEEIKIKISNRTQRKFAILSISDNSVRSEIPIWPEMYEEVEGLLTEGNLLFAILSKAMKEGTMRTQCLYLNVLDQVDAESVSVLAALHEKRSLKKKKTDVQQKEAIKMKLEIAVEMEQITLSTILELKKLFRKYAGPNDVHLHYHLNEEKMATLEITQPWGVDASKEFLDHLHKIKGVKKIEIVDSTLKV